MKFLHMSKELNGLSGQVLSQWFPMEKSSHAGAEENWTVKEAWEGRGPGCM